MTVTIKDVDENSYRNFKAEAARRGMNLSEAATEAFRLWTNSKRFKRVRNTGKMEKAAENMDELRKKSNESWSGSEEIRKWREERK